MILHRAKSIRTTRSRRTRIRTLVVHTSLIRCTICGRPTADLTRYAGTNFLRATVVIFSAQSLTDIIVAHFVDIASFVVETHVLTRVSAAHLLFSALCIAATRHRLPDTAGYSRWIRDESFRTGTLGTMVDNFTGCARSAGVYGARVDTSVV